MSAKFATISNYIYVSYFNSVSLCRTIETPLFSLAVVIAYNYTFSYFEFPHFCIDFFSVCKSKITEKANFGI